MATFTSKYNLGQEVWYKSFRAVPHTRNVREKCPTCGFRMTTSCTFRLWHPDAYVIAGVQFLQGEPTLYLFHDEDYGMGEIHEYELYPTEEEAQRACDEANAVEKVNIERWKAGENIGGS